MATTYKGFIKDWQGNRILPITRGELILDSRGYEAFHSEQFLAVLPQSDEDSGRPGLVTGAERAALQKLSEGTASTILDIYNKLTYINTGLYVGDDYVSFYDNSSNTPIKLLGEYGITVTKSDNNIQLSLTSINSDLKKAGTNEVVKSINYDNFGRVSDVVYGKLTSDDIPEIIVGKLLRECTTTDPSDDSHIANKKYVDTAVSKANQIATGALVFKGSIGNSDTLKLVFTNGVLNTYYKVTSDFEVIDTSIIIDTDSQFLKAGDSLVLWSDSGIKKFTHIPSGDDITTITINNVVKNALGDVSLTFEAPFNVRNSSSDGNSNNAIISIPAASENISGYLTWEDWKRFNDASSTAVSIKYIPTITELDKSAYLIGNINIGNTQTPIYGKNDTYTLLLVNGEEYPTLVFKNVSDTTLTTALFVGSNGIETSLNGNKFTFKAKNEVLSSSIKYLEVLNGYQFGVKLGYLKDNEEVEDGLTDYREFIETTSTISAALMNMVDKITYSLKGEATTNEPYKYGSADILAAITLTI